MERTGLAPADGLHHGPRFHLRQRIPCAVGTPVTGHRPRRAGAWRACPLGWAIGCQEHRVGRRASRHRDPPAVRGVWPWRWVTPRPPAHAASDPTSGEVSCSCPVCQTVLPQGTASGPPHRARDMTLSCGYPSRPPGFFFPGRSPERTELSGARLFAHPLQRVVRCRRKECRSAQ